MSEVVRWLIIATTFPEILFLASTDLLIYLRVRNELLLHDFGAAFFNQYGRWVFLSPGLSYSWKNHLPLRHLSLHIDLIYKQFATSADIPTLRQSFRSYGEVFLLHQIRANGSAHHKLP